MKTLQRILPTLLIPLALLGFTACDPEGPTMAGGGNPFGYQGQPGPGPGAGPGPATAPQYGAAYGQGPGPAPTRPSVSDSNPVVEKKVPSKPENTVNNTPAAPPSGPANTPSYPKGIPVPDKPGFVMSPYTKPDQGYVDVRGYPPGMEVKDPYTGGVFLVP